MTQRGMTYDEARSLSPGDAVEVFQPSEDEHGNVGPGGEWHPAQVLPGGVRECNPDDGRGPRIIVDIRFSEKQTRTDYCTVYVLLQPVQIGPEIRFPKSSSDPLLEACEVVLKYEDHRFKTSNVTGTKPILSWNNDELIAEIKRLNDKIKVLEKQLRKGPEELRASMEVTRVSCMGALARANFLASSNVFRVEAQIRGIDAFLEWQNEEYRVAVDKASKDLELTVIEKIGTEP